MRVLIVYAHHEAQSFNSAMRRTAERALLAAGHDVCVSDLYEMGFDPVSDRRNFTTVANPHRLDQQAEERLAASEGGFAPDVAVEIQKLLWCDLLILQFPVWWMGMPAIMKGWIDRVLALGVAYGGGRWFDQGKMVGKRAMLAITLGGPAIAYTDRGIYGPIDIVTQPLNHGVLGFVGFSVIEPFIVYGPGRMIDAQRAEILDSYAERLRHIDRAPLVPQLRSADYDGFVLRNVRPDVCAA